MDLQSDLDARLADRQTIAGGGFSGEPASFWVATGTQTEVQGGGPINWSTAPASLPLVSGSTYTVHVRVKDNGHGFDPVTQQIEGFVRTIVADAPEHLDRVVAFLRRTLGPK